jgi:hypothetical protein
MTKVSEEVADRSLTRGHRHDQRSSRYIGYLLAFICLALSAWTAVFPQSQTQTFTLNGLVVVNREFQLSGFRNFKTYYTQYVCGELTQTVHSCPFLGTSDPKIEHRILSLRQIPKFNLNHSAT